MKHNGAQICATCDYKWLPCESPPSCRGFRIELHTSEGPLVRGCPDCDKANGGVPDRIARTWPEAYQVMARELAPYKMVSTTTTVLVGRRPRK